MADNEVVKLYRRVGKESAGVVVSLHREFERMLGQVFHEYHRSGGRSGDLGVEVASLTVYNDGQTVIQFYVVTDDNPNEFSVCMSVIVLGDDVRCESITNNLRLMLDFVTCHSSFKKRAPGHHTFADYLDEPYAIPRNGPFAVR